MTGSDLEFYAHGYVAASVANGPGIRSVIWFQGCSIGCPGCFNELTHKPAGVKPLRMKTLYQEIELAVARHGIEGITISGGEPFDQPAALATLVRWAKDVKGLSVVLFTGYRPTELEAKRPWNLIRNLVDVTIAGRYVSGLRTAHSLEGSANKKFIFCQGSAYTRSDFDHIPPAEIIFTDKGALMVSGIRPDLVSGLFVE